MVILYGEELLALRPTPKLEDNPLSAVRDCLFNVFAATLHIRRPFLHPQPEGAPCRGDRYTTCHESFATIVTKQPALILLYKTIKLIANSSLFWILKSRKFLSKAQCRFLHDGFNIH
jgi:hypothetical protein